MFALGFIWMFMIGGFSGVMHSAAPADAQQHDSYFVVAHFHYVLIGGSLFALLAGIHYWFPLMFGRRVSEFWGKLSFWVIFAGFNVTFFPMHFLGLAGMPRRVPDYALQFADFNMLASIGAFGFGLAQLLFVWGVIKCVRGGAKAGDKPWEGADTLEWTLPSPPPYHSFETPPVVR